MKYLAFLLILLVACVPIPEEPVKQEPAVEKESEPVKQAYDTTFALPVHTVTATEGQHRLYYGFSEDYKLLEVKDGENWQFAYEDEHLARVKGISDTRFTYADGNLVEISDGTTLKHDAQGIHITGKDKVTVFYDGFGQLKRLKRGVAGETSFEHSDDGLITKIKRGSVDRNLQYDDRQRLRSIITENDDFIFGYWRDDRISSLTGSIFGAGVTVSYNAHPPREAEVFSQDGTIQFSSTNTESLYKAVDYYIYCTQVRRLQVPYDPIALTFYTAYFGGTFQEYLAMEYLCKAYE